MNDDDYLDLLEDEFVAEADRQDELLKELFANLRKCKTDEERLFYFSVYERDRK